ncbi:MAG: YCF48-related protein [Burkholderiales bacterium]|jgi:photosystem II stability/assembly factor-like uncharacterized protein|nr:YCF48-related protein [Burkholderiales bacterium]
MQKIIGLFLIACIAGIVGYAFSHRPPVLLPATEESLRIALIEDAQKAGDRLIAVGDAGRIFYSDDAGKTWQFVASPTKATLTRLRMFNDKIGIAVGHDAVILKTEDAGLTWVEKYSAPDDEAPLMDVVFLDEQNLIAVGAYHQYLVSTDAGNTWERQSISQDDKHLNSIVRLNETTLLLVGESGTAKVSSDNGEKWVAVASPYGGSYFGIVPVNETTAVLFGMRGHVMRYTVGAKTLEPVEMQGTASLFAGRMIDKQVVLAGQEGTVWVSGDEGKTFTKKSTPGNLLHMAILPVSKTKWLALGERGAVEMTAVVAEGGARE